MKVTPKMIFYRWLLAFLGLLAGSIFIIGGKSWQPAVFLTVIYVLIFGPMLLWVDPERSF